jgi:uncharacterized protein (DUF2235 family)
VAAPTNVAKLALALADEDREAKPQLLHYQAGVATRAGHRHRVEEAYALYRDPHRDTEPAGIASKLFRRTHSYDDVSIEFVGVWDTVGALGV